MKKYLSMKMKKNFYFILFHVCAIIFNFCIPNVLSDDYFYDDPSIPYSNSLSECQLDTLVAISFFACEHDGQASFIEKNYMNIEALLKRMFSEKSLEQWNQNALERSSSYVKDLFKERPKQKLLEGKLLFRAEKIVEQYFFYENKKKLEYIEKNINKPWNWGELSYNYNSTMEFIDKYSNKDWKKLLKKTDAHQR